MMIFHTKMPYKVPNDVIMWHEKRIKLNILISACNCNCKIISALNSTCNVNQKRMY